MSKPKLLVLVSSDLSTDQRVQKVSESLVKHGCEVTLVGRTLKTSKPFESKKYRVHRVKLWFNKGVLFYANLNIRYFFLALFSNVDILYVNDLDTLSGAYWSSRFRNKKIIYDSHEYFTEVPELIHRKRVQRIWEIIERSIVPNLKYCVTVTEKIAEVYRSKYNVDFKVLRNFPLKHEFSAVAKEDYIIYQGALNVGRGVEELIEAMQYVNCNLKIAGTGDIEKELKEQTKRLKLESKIEFIGRVDPAELKIYTRKAKLGISIEKKEGLNYTYALPNKVFDYIHANTPVLYSDLIEVKRTLDGMQIGEELKSYNARELALQINKMLVNADYMLWQKSCKLLSEKLNWQNEEKVLFQFIDSIEE